MGGELQGMSIAPMGEILDRLATCRRVNGLARVMVASFGICVYGAEFYVSPSGSPAGTGSPASPWDFATAVAHPPAVRPGDTIYLRGGIYRGSFRSVLQGTPCAPIVVRPYPNEHAVLDGASAPNPNAPMYGALTISGDHTWFRDFEITNSYPTRVYPANSCLEYQHCRGHGVDVFGAGTKLINLVIHDTSDAVGLWAPAIGAEVTGNIIYYIGNQTEIRGHGMGIYAQNDAGIKRITNNIIFSGFHSGIQIYGSGASSLRNIIVEGNTVFQNGLLASDPNGWGILVGGNVIADTITIRNNYLFNPNWFIRGSNANPSWGVHGATRLTFTGNDSSGLRSIEYTTAPTNSTVSGNRLFGMMNDIADASVSKTANTVAAVAPAGARVYYRDNPHDPGRTNVTIFNGGGAPSVRIHPPLLAEGDAYELRDVQNYFGAPLLRGVYSATGGLDVPMNSTVLSPIVGSPPRQPVPSGPQFGSFVLRKMSSGGSGAAAASCGLSIVSPANGSDVNSTVVNFSWTQIPGATRYELRVSEANTPQQFRVELLGEGSTSAIYTFPSGNYRAEVRGCDAGVCGPAAVTNYTVRGGAIPSSAPGGAGCAVVNESGQNRLDCNWTAVPGAHFYFVNVVQPGAGPGGGALTVAGRQTGTKSISVLVPNGNATVLVRACTGDGCGPPGSGVAINPSIGNPTVPLLGEPFGGSSVDSGSSAPNVTFSWNRVAGDNGRNFMYRLFVQDFSRNVPALDIMTRENFFGAFFNPGTRYDALVVAIPVGGGAPRQGPPNAFMARGRAPRSPVLTAPTAGSVVSRGVQGEVGVSWTPLVNSDGTVAPRNYQYFFAGPRQVSGTVAATSVFLSLEPGSWQGIVRACLAGTSCTENSPVGWGPWNNETGAEGGMTAFMVQ